MSENNEDKKINKFYVFAAISLMIGVGYYSLSSPEIEEEDFVEEEIIDEIDVEKIARPAPIKDKVQIKKSKMKIPINPALPEEEVDEDSLGFAYSEVLNSFELALEEKQDCEETLNSFKGNGIFDQQFNVVTDDLIKAERFIFDNDFINYQETSEAETNYGFFANDFIEASGNLWDGFKPVYYRYKDLYCDFDLQRDFLQGVLSSAPYPLKEKFATISFARLCQKLGHTTHPGVMNEYSKEIEALAQAKYQDPAFNKFFTSLQNDYGIIKQKLQNMKSYDANDQNFDRRNWNGDALKAYLDNVDDNEDFSREVNEFICGRLPKILEIDQELRRTLPNEDALDR